MPLKIDYQHGGNALHLIASGQLKMEDYERCVPKIEELLCEHGKMNVLLELRDFHGWDLAAAWEELKFDAKHFNDLGRVALLGENQWQRLMAIGGKLLTNSEFQYFERDKEDEARVWVGLTPANAAVQD